MDYINDFDKEVIEYLKGTFHSIGIDAFSVRSNMVGDGTYEIRFDNDEFVFQFYYRKEDLECEAQININSI